MSTRRPNTYAAETRHAAEAEIALALTRTPGMGIAEIAAATGRSRNNASAHLARMVADGTLVYALERPHGRRKGPPSKVYRLAPPRLAAG